MLDVRHTTFAGKIFEQSLLIQYRVRFALLLIILGQPFIEGCNSIKIPDFRHFLTSFPSFIRSHIQWTACNIYPKTSFPFDFALTDDEMAQVAALNKNVRYYTSTPELLKKYAEMVPPVDEQK